MERLLDTFDDWAARDGATPDVGGAGALRADARARDRRRCSSICASGAIRSIVWATGFRPDYRWLHVPVVDEKGHLRHDGGVVDEPRAVRARPAGAAAPQVHLHPRHRRRRARRDRPSGGLSRHARVCRDGPASRPARGGPMPGANGSRRRSGPRLVVVEPLDRRFDAVHVVGHPGAGHVPPVVRRRRRQAIGILAELLHARPRVVELGLCAGPLPSPCPAPRRRPRRAPASRPGTRHASR